MLFALWEAMAVEDLGHAPGLLVDFRFRKDDEVAVHAASFNLDLCSQSVYSPNDLPGAKASLLPILQFRLPRLRW